MAATRFRRMPISEATSPSSAAERMAIPKSVNLNATQKPATSSAATAPAITREVATRMPASSVTSFPHGAPMLSTSVPIRRESSVASRMSTPSVRIASVPRSARRMRRIRTASIRIEAAAATSTPSATASANPTDSCARAITYAPSSSTEPCAKLITCVALKTVTNPSATSE